MQRVRAISWARSPAQWRFSVRVEQRFAQAAVYWLSWVIIAMVIFAGLGSLRVVAQTIETERTTTADTVSDRSTTSSALQAQQTSQLDLVQREATRWGLTTEEYERYLFEMKGLRGKLSDDSITPYEVLGIQAESSAEQRRYALMYVEAMAADTQRVLDFSRIVHQTWQREYGDVSLLNVGLINQQRRRNGSKWGPIAEILNPSQITGRLSIFVPIDCGSCRNDIVDIVDQVGAGLLPGADLYVLNAPSDSDRAVRDWARSMQVPIELVSSRKVTLNVDTGEFDVISEQLGQSLPASAMPLILHRKSKSEFDIVRMKRGTHRTQFVKVAADAAR